MSVHLSNTIDIRRMTNAKNANLSNLLFFIFGTLTVYAIPQNPKVLEWLSDQNLNLTVDTTIPVSASYWRCSGDPHGFVGEAPSGGDDVLCFDIFGDVEGNYLLFHKATPGYNEFFDDVTCENHEASLECPPGKLIETISASYGRMDMTTCPDPPLFEDTSCYSNMAFFHVQDHCDSKNNCTFNVNDDFFEFDPCSGTHKYSMVSYKCYDPLIPPPQDFSVIAHFAGQIIDQVGVSIAKLTFCFDFIHSSIVIDLQSMVLIYNGVDYRWTWGQPNVLFVEPGIKIENENGHVIKIFVEVGGVIHMFQVMRPHVGDYFLSITLLSPTEHLGGLMGQIHDFRIYTKNTTAVGDFGIADVNGSENFFLTQRMIRGDLNCWYYKDIDVLDSPIYGDITQFSQSEC